MLFNIRLVDRAIKSSQRLVIRIWRLTLQIYLHLYQRPIFLQAGTAAELETVLSIICIQKRGISPLSLKIFRYWIIRRGS